MEDIFLPIAIVGILFIGAPAVVFHYLTEWRKTKSMSTDDERLIDDLWRTAQRLERRVEALETILDREAPDWREERGERPHA
ncbi:MAG: envelope stress response membrane protein PspB [Pseudomonadota bacterium]